jgi:hypothetical protein
VNKQQSTNVYESDSENTDGYFSDTGSCFGGTTTIAEQMKQREKNKDIDDISEHSSDEVSSESNEEGFIAKEADKKAKKKVKDPDGTRKKKNKDGQPKDKNKKKDGKPDQKEPPPKSKKDGEAKPIKDAKVKNKPPEVGKQLMKSEKSKKDGKDASFKQKPDADSFTSPQKKKKKATNEKTLGQLNPKNCFEQQELFFANDCQVDPIFEYENILATQKTMQNFN